MARKKPSEISPVNIRTCLFGKFIDADAIIDSDDLIADNLQHITKLLNGCTLCAGMKRLLAVKLLPGSAYMTVTDKCAIAGVDRRYWYQYHSRPEFIDACAHYSRKLLAKMMLPEIIGTHVKKAMLGDNKSAQLILEYAQELEKIAGEGKTGFPSITLNATTINIIEQDNLKKGLEKFGITIPQKRFEVSDN